MVQSEEQRGTTGAAWCKMHVVLGSELYILRTLTDKTTSDISKF
jgi:hypothetical protein